MHLCEVCAHDKGSSRRSDRIELSLSQLLTGLLDLKGGGDTEAETTECPTCGMNVADFKRDGRVGCPECYVSFASEIRRVHKRLSGVSRHKGKLPQKLRTYKELLIDRERLRGQLETAVEHEDYETAAIIRDQIREIEKVDGVSNG